MWQKTLANVIIDSILGELFIQSSKNILQYAIWHANNPNIDQILRNPESHMTADYENKLRDLWNQSRHNIPRPIDPLILDLNRDSKLELQNATFFDLNADGFHEYTRWISETDAFLVLDKNADALINNGGEMFGDAMILPDDSRALAGFDALRAYDSNEDGCLLK